MNALTNSLKSSVIDLRGPHPLFRYPDPPTIKMQEDPQESLLDLRRLIWVNHPEDVYVFQTLKDCLKDWLTHARATRLAQSTVYAFEPFTTELVSACRELDLELKAIPRDPEDWQDSLSPATACAAILSNPNQSDGFFYLDEHFTRLIETFVGRHEIPILSDESLQSFTFSSVAPATLKKSRLNTPNLFVAASVFPALSPQGPRVSWWIDNPSKKLRLSPPPLNCSPEELHQSIRALMAFYAKQGATVAEFHRRMLALRQGLRRMTDLLNPAIAQKRLSIPHWPEAGFHIAFQLHAPEYKSPRELQAALIEQENLWIDISLERESSGSPYYRICFAAPERILKEAAERLTHFLIKS